MSTQRFVLFFVLEYLVGSIMFSDIIAKAHGINLRTFRDGNPGGANLWRLKGFGWGFLGIFLDYLKGFIPLYFIISHNNFTALELSLIAIAPLLGHLFPPMLKFKGGKGISTTFGIWSALTKYEVPLLLGFVFTIFVFIRKEDTTPEFDAVRALTGMIVAIIFVFIFHREFTLVAILNLVLLVFSHRKEIYNIMKGVKI